MLELVQCVFQGFAWTELRHLGGLDFDGGASAGIAASTSSAFGHGERVKTNQGDCAALFQGFLDRFDGGVDGATRSGFRNVGLIGDVFDEFRLVHKNFLEKKSQVDRQFYLKNGGHVGRCLCVNCGVKTMFAQAVVNFRQI